jgi:hypothetical protein
VLSEKCWSVPCAVYLIPSTAAAVPHDDRRTIQQQQPHAQQQHTKKNMHTHNHHPRESFEVNEEVAGKETKEQMTTLFTRNDKYGQR